MTGFRASVVVPAYNAGRFLAETLDSALAQTLPPHEVLVVDDGSTDDTPAVAARYAGRVTYYRQANAGVSAARNAALGRVTGDWVAFLDADDLWEPHYLERVRPVCLSVPRPALVFADFRTFGTAAEPGRAAEAFASWDPAAELLTPTVSVMPSATLVPADTPVRFPEWAANDEDAIFFNEASELGPVRCVPEELMRYRKHPTSAQARVGDGLVGCENVLRWARGHEAARPGTVHRFFRTLARSLVKFRWRRNWPRYWRLRRFCDVNWPADLPRPPVLSERVWPSLVYRVKDALDRLRRPAAEGRA